MSERLEPNSTSSTPEPGRPSPDDIPEATAAAPADAAPQAEISMEQLARITLGVVTERNRREQSRRGKNDCILVPPTPPSPRIARKRHP